MSKEGNVLYRQGRPDKRLNFAGLGSREHELVSKSLDDSCAKGPSTFRSVTTGRPTTPQYAKAVRSGRSAQTLYDCKKQFVVRPMRHEGNERFPRLASQAHIRHESMLPPTPTVSWRHLFDFALVHASLPILRAVLGGPHVSHCSGLATVPNGKLSLFHETPTRIG